MARIRYMIDFTSQTFLVVLDRSTRTQIFILFFYQYSSLWFKSRRLKDRHLTKLLIQSGCKQTMVFTFKVFKTF